jgi:hypothetical protein
MLTEQKTRYCLDLSPNRKLQQADPLVERKGADDA